MKQLLAVLAAVIVALVPAAASAQAAVSPTSATTPKYRAIFHVSSADPRGWNQALNNSLALTKNAGKNNVDIRIVVIGLGISMLKENSPAAKLVAAALSQDVKVLACGETMKALALEKQDMLPNIGYVPGGIIEILDRQGEGWRYIRVD